MGRQIKISKTISTAKSSCVNIESDSRLAVKVQEFIEGVLNRSWNRASPDPEINILDIQNDFFQNINNELNYS